MNRIAPATLLPNLHSTDGYVELAHTRTESLRHTVVYRKHTRDYALYTTSKVMGGVRHLFWPCRYRLSVQELAAKCLQQGTFSQRPYRLGQGLDLSIGICVYALYEHYCAAGELNPSELLERSYPHLERRQGWPPELWADIREWAQWEGILFPSAWTAEDARLLLRSLRLIGRPFLADVLEDRPLAVPPPRPTRNVASHRLHGDYGGVFDGFRVTSDADPGL